jgi:hypothetical protein
MADENGHGRVLCALTPTDRLTLDPSSTLHLQNVRYFSYLEALRGRSDTNDVALVVLPDLYRALRTVGGNATPQA